MATSVMASPRSTPSCLCSSTSRKSPSYTLSTRAVLQTRIPNFRFSKLCPQLGLSLFSPWNGLRHLGVSIRQKSVQIEKKGKCRGKGVYASLFGVGAPEALVIGVVALLIFGPKGLAEVARNLGKTLRAFQPTIKELQEVSREFKSSLEREIGLDDIQRSTQDAYSSKYNNATSTPSSISNPKDSQTVAEPNGAPSPSRAVSSDELLKISEEQLKASAVKQQGQLASPTANQSEPQTETQGNVQDAESQMPQLQKPENDT